MKSAKVSFTLAVGDSNPGNPHPHKPMTLQQAIIKSGLTVRIFCDCWDGSIAGHAGSPDTGTPWSDVPDTLHTAGAYYHLVRWTDVPADHPILNRGELPENCYLDNGHFDDVLN